MTVDRPLAVGLTPMETRRPVVLRLAQRAEQLGYHAFYLAEAWGHDATVLLTEVATRTERIRLGTGVLNIWGRSPASLAMLGDLNVAEPRALIGFAGPRVIQQTVRETLPEGFQRSEFLLDHGALDLIVDRRDMREKLGGILRLLMRQPAAVAAPLQ